MHYPDIDFAFIAHKYDLVETYGDGADLRTVCLIAGDEVDLAYWVKNEGAGYVTHISQADADTLGKALMPEHEGTDPETGDPVTVPVFSITDHIGVDSRFPSEEVVDPT